MSLHCTQFPGTVKKQSHTVVVGLDFGTSSSKVVINNQTANVAFAIPFGEFGHPSNRYLIPTRPFFNKNGRFCLCSQNDGIPVRELKGAIMGKSPSNFDFASEKELKASVHVLTIAYLAHVIRQSREWYLTNQRKAFGHTNINWQLNIGIPSVGNQFQSKKGLFKQLITGAWWLSTQTGEITLVLAEKACDMSKKLIQGLIDIHSDDINVIPEIVAEVIGYARSDQRNKGLHLLIDVGAGTVDIASFNLGKEKGSDKFSIFTGDVEWLGAFELHKHRSNGIKQRIVKWLDNFAKNEDPVSAIPDRVSSYLPDLISLNIKRNREIDLDVFKRCYQFVQKTMICLRRKRDPHSPQWQSGIPTFICGGGSQIKFYQEVLNEVTGWWINNCTAGLRLLDIPKPCNLQMKGLSDKEFFRLAVAYGLSFPEYDIGIIYSPDEIEDMFQRSKVDYESRYIDKDQV